MSKVLSPSFAPWLERTRQPPRPPEEREGAAMITLSGEPWWPHDPHPEDVRYDDFPAIALVMRWGGHMRYAPNHCRAGRLAPYSVGQHSCLVYELVTTLGGSWMERAAALFHDIHEIVPPGDSPSPVTRGSLPAAEHIGQMSRMAEICFRTKLGLPLDLPPIVKHADAVLLVTEHRDLSRPPNQAELVDHGWPRDIKPLPRIIEAWDVEHTVEAFARRCKALDKELDR